jgi:hypothetical protein
MQNQVYAKCGCGARMKKTASITDGLKTESIFLCPACRSTITVKVM